MNKPISFAIRVRRLVLAFLIVLWIVAFTTTHIPAERLPHFHFTDIIMHAGGYFALSSCFLLTLVLYGRKRSIRVSLVLGILLAYAAIDELTQQLMNRDAALEDWLADVAGTAAAVICWEAVFLLIALRKKFKADAAA